MNNSWTTQSVNLYHVTYSMSDILDKITKIKIWTHDNVLVQKYLPLFLSVSIISTSIV